MKKYIIIIGCMVLSSCASIHERYSSTTNCCKIEVLNHVVKYESDGYHVTEEYDATNKEQVINSFMEYCYHNHN